MKSVADTSSLTRLSLSKGCSVSMSNKKADMEVVRFRMISLRLVMSTGGRVRGTPSRGAVEGTSRKVDIRVQRSGGSINPPSLRSDIILEILNFINPTLVILSESYT